MKIKKVISVLLALIISSAIFVTYAFAYSASSLPAKTGWAYLNQNQSYAYSTDTSIGQYKYFGGANYSSSSHRMTVGAQYFDGSSNDWLFDSKYAVSIGTMLDPVKTDTYAGYLSWRVHLSPYAAFTSGVNGEGFIYLTL